MATNLSGKNLQLCGRALAVLVTAGIVSFSGLARAAPIQIAITGDSNIAGKGVSSSDTYPAKLERALRARGYDVRVLNTGVNGDTVMGLLSRLDSAVPQGTQIAIVWVGINDVRAGRDLSVVQATRQKITARLQARGIKVLNLGRQTGAGLRDNPKLLVGDSQLHFNSAGYDQVVTRTLSQVQALIRQVSHRH